LQHPAKGSSILKRRYVVPANFTEEAAREIHARPRLIVGISGASGAIYGARLLELLRPLPVETHLVISRTADVTLAVETDLKPAAVRARADVVHSNSDMAAPISSGSFKTIGMVVAPCSIRSMAEIASGVTTTLLSRAADVVLKERRRLVLLVRETPLHTGHLRTMTALSEMGAVIAPPVPAFYAKPQTLDEMIDQTLGRILDLFDLETGLVRRWGERLVEDGRPLRSKPPRGKV
jgi:4-hydroxy-3-polyprenylbenzoate decarboxylase